MTVSSRKPAPWLRLLGLVLLGFLLWRLDSAELLRTLRQIDWRLLLVAVLLNLPLVLFKSLRWGMLLHAQDIAYDVRRVYLAYFGSIFIGLLTPGRLGEFVKAVHVSQDCGVPLVRTLTSVLVDRLFDIALLLLVGGGALLAFSPDASAIGALVLSALLLAVPLALFLHPSSFRLVQRGASRLGTVGEKLFAEQGWFVTMRQGMLQLTWGYLVTALLFTLGAYALFFSQCYLLALAMDLPLGFVTVSYAVAIGSLVTLLPVSVSGLGTREAAMIAYLGTAGVAGEEALGFSLLVFATFYLAGGVFGAVAWLLKPVSFQVLRSACAAE